MRAGALAGERRARGVVPRAATLGGVAQPQGSAPRVNPLARPLHLEPQALREEALVRERYARALLDELPCAVAVLELCSEVGVLGGEEIESALARNDAGEPRPLLALVEDGLARVALGLNAGVGDSADGVGPVLRLSVESHEGVTLFVVEAVAGLMGELPLLRMEPECAALCLGACGLLEDALGVYVTRYWGLGGLSWSEEERLDAFLELSDGERADPERFADACRENEALGWCLLGGDAQSATEEEAREVIATLEGYVGALAQVRAIAEAAGARSWTAGGLAVAGRALAERAQSGETRAWARWVCALAEALGRAQSRTPARPVAWESDVDLGVALNIRIDAPWVDAEAEQELEMVNNVGERIVCGYAWSDGQGRAILDALEGLGDLMRLILACPTEANP